MEKILIFKKGGDPSPSLSLRAVAHTLRVTEWGQGDKNLS